MFSCHITIFVLYTCTSYPHACNLIKRLPPLIGRFVPFVAIVAANMANIPLMRSEELKNGVPVTDKDGNKLGDELSKVIYFVLYYVSSYLSILYLGDICCLLYSGCNPPILINL